MAEGFAWPPRQQVEPGTARPRQQPEVGSADIRFSEDSGKPENSGTPIYGSRIRRQNPRQRRPQLLWGTPPEFSENEES